VEHGGQGREELGSESGPLKLRQLSGLLLGFLDKRHAWKRWSEKSGINTEAIPVKRRARGNGARSRFGGRGWEQGEGRRLRPTGA
jgi:hypothetical protein